MRSSQSRRGWLSALLATLLLLAATVTSAVTAAATDPPQFGMSASSGRAGSTVFISPVDSCPAIPTGFDYQWVEVVFTDADAVETVNTVFMDTYSDGTWSGTGGITLPGRRLTQYDPPVFVDEAAIGLATIELRCIVGASIGDEMDPSDDATEVSQEYASQTFNVTAGSLQLNLSVTTAATGTELHITSPDPCVGPNAQISGNILNTDAAVTLPDVTISSTGTWSMDVPLVTTAMDGGARELPPGVYGISLLCYTGATASDWGSSDYAAQTLEVTGPSREYVAMGDSYSAGVGTFNYDSPSGECYRSEDSYVPYVADQLDLDTPYFVACSGAQTPEIYARHPHTDEPDQLSALSEKTQVVTLTIGGNDAGFSDVIKKCIRQPDNDGWGCADDSSLTAGIAERFDALAGDASAEAIDGRSIVALQQVYGDIAAAAPDAKIYVGGYPRLFGSHVADYTANSSAPGGAQCTVTVGATISFGDAQWLNQKANELNGIIEEAVDAAQDDGADITYVPAALFSGHEVCGSSDLWINDVAIDANGDPRVESFHPTVEGYQNGYGIAFTTIMN